MLEMGGGSEARSHWRQSQSNGTVLAQCNNYPNAVSIDRVLNRSVSRPPIPLLAAPELSTKRPARARVRNHSATSSYLQFIAVPTVTAANAAAPMETDNQSVSLSLSAIQRESVARAAAGRAPVD